MILEDKLLCDTLTGIDELYDFDEFDLSNPEFVEALSKVKKLVIGKIKPAMSKETIDELQAVLKYMKSLEHLSVKSYSKERSDIDISSIFDALPDSMQRISLSGVNFSQTPELERFEQLKFFSVDGSDLSSIPTLSKKSDGIISLGNDLPNISNYTIIDEFIQGKKISTSNEEVRTVLLGLSSDGSIPLKSYEKYYDQIKKANGKELSIKIHDASELSGKRLEFLVKVNPNIKRIFMEYGIKFKDDDPKYQYSVEEYASIRTKIDEIVSQIRVPSQDDPDREKKIFAQIYMILGKQISYDHFAVTEEGEKDRQLMIDSRNLRNALLGVERNGKRQHLAVCAGIADALGNVASCFGIKTEYIGTLSEPELVNKGGAWVEKTNEKGKIVRRNGTTDPMGHAYNMVELDGKKYYCDLTWDMSTIKENKIPLAHFLRSADDFLKSHRDEGFEESVADKSADESFPFEKQAKLFKDSGIQIGDEKQQNILTINQMLNENYLCGFLKEYVEYVKHGRTSITYPELLEIMNSVKMVENAILSSNGGLNKSFSIKGPDGSNRFSFDFETSNPVTLKKLKDEISKRRERSDRD